MTDKKVVHHDFCGMVTDRSNRKIANQGKEEVIIKPIINGIVCCVLYVGGIFI